MNGQAAELWFLKEAFHEDLQMLDCFTDGIDFIRQRNWQCLPLVEEVTATEALLLAPPWILLRTIAERANNHGGLAPAFVLSFIRDLARDIATEPETVVRSLSPNAMAVSIFGRPRLLDLSIARFKRRRSETTPGVIKGEISFMSPELVRGRPLDARSDVFALGLIAFELLTGVRAFRGGNDLDSLQRIARADFPSLPRLRETHPPVLADLVTRMLARERDGRPWPQELVTLTETAPDLAPFRWTNEQMFDEIRRVAPADVDEAITYGL